MRKRVGSIFLVSFLILGFLGNPLSFPKIQNIGEGDNFYNSFLMKAFAETDKTNAENNPDNSFNSSSEGDLNLNNNMNSSSNGEGDLNLNNSMNVSSSSEGDLNMNSMNGSNGEGDHNNANSGVQGENVQNNSNSSAGDQGDAENENNNEKAMHEKTQQDDNNVNDAKKSDTIAAEVDVNNENVNTQSIDNNVSVTTEYTTNDAVSIRVNASSNTGPKVLLIDLNSTTIDVAKMKFIDVRYDGNHITPAANIDVVLHPNSSDQPHYAILVTQSGAQILVSIPHFSTHTITVSQINKVMLSSVPEFPSLYAMVFAISIFSMIGFSMMYRKNTRSLFSKI